MTRITIEFQGNFRQLGRMAICRMALSSQDCAKHRGIRNDPTRLDGLKLPGVRLVVQEGVDLATEAEQS